MPAVLALDAAPAVTLVAVVVIIAVLVAYLVAVILQLRRISAGLDVVAGSVGELVSKTEPVGQVVHTINGQLDAGVDLLEGLLVRKAGLEDAVGLVDGLYPGAAAAGFRQFKGSATARPPRIGETYTRGTLTLARLGREAPIATANPAGPAIRNASASSSASRRLYGDPRKGVHRSPAIGVGAPVQYAPDEDVGGPRKHLPSRES